MFNPSATMASNPATSAVLKNTYTLLSMTLLFSALTAFLGMNFPVTGLASIGIFVVVIGLLFAIRAYRNSPVGVALVFALTGLMGFSLGPTLNHQLGMAGGGQTVGLALLTTGAAFFGLSGYVHATKKDFSFMGGFLFIALLGLVLVTIVNIFFPVPGLSLALAYFSALLFSGYILYDTSNIVNGHETNYVSATVSLYLDIFNLFTALLRIFGGRS